MLAAHLLKKIWWILHVGVYHSQIPLLDKLSRLSGSTKVHVEFQVKIPCILPLCKETLRPRKTIK